MLTNFQFGIRQTVSDLLEKSSTLLRKLNTLNKRNAFSPNSVRKILSQTLWLALLTVLLKAVSRIRLFLYLLALPQQSFFLFQNRSLPLFEDRKSTRLNSSHVRISYAVFCLKKKKK